MRPARDPELALSESWHLNAGNQLRDMLPLPDQC